MCVGFPLCSRASLTFSAATTWVSYAQNLRSGGRPHQRFVTCALLYRPVNALQLTVKTQMQFYTSEMHSVLLLVVQIIAY